MKIKVLSLSIIISICAFFGMNVFAEYFTGFWYELELAKRPELVTANITQGLMNRELADLKLTREKIANLNKLAINSRSAISVQGDKELFSINPDDRVPFASIAKLMTVVIVLDNYEPNLLIPITEKAVNQEGDSGNLIIGEKLEVKELLYTTLIESSNDAAYALTEPVGYDAFIELMNFQAEKIGMNNTYFVNPNGLEPDDPEKTKNYSTARDLVKLVNYILENYPEVFEITTNDYYKVLKPDGTIHHIIKSNTNKLLGEFPGIIGGKTGYSPAAGECLLTIFKDSKGKKYINIVLGSRDRFGDMRQIITAIQ
ncbi:serine hydrolase [Patescibacteria group bacterium]|nr:serine hydrolase [Patescibacteria group bacterium]